MSIQALTYVIEHCEATQGARNVMFAIANHADERGENCWASVATLAHEARLSERATQYALDKLRDTSEIEVTGVHDSGTTIYRICAMADRVDQLPLVAAKGGATSAPGGAKNDRRGCKERQEGVQPAAPKPSKEPSDKPTTLITSKIAPLSHLLADLIAEQDPDGKRPRVSAAWADAERLMIDRDGRDPVVAEQLLRWTMQDGFWRKNVRSMPKFREKYGQLYANAQEAHRKREHPVDARLRALAPAVIGGDSA